MHKQQHYLILLLLTLGVSHLNGMDAVLAELIDTKEKQEEQARNLAAAAVSEKPKKQELTLTFQTPAEFLTRIQLANKKIQEQTASLEPLVTQQKGLNSEQVTLGMHLAALLKTKRPVQEEMQKLTAQKRTLINQETTLTHTKQAAYRLVETYVVEKAFQDALKNTTKQQLTPLLIEKLTLEKKELAKKIAAVSAQWKALNQQLNPLEAQEKQLSVTLEKNKAALRELVQTIESVHTTKTEAELEKFALFKGLDQKLADTIAAKEQLEDEVVAIRATIAEEKDTKQKIALRTELSAKERAIGEHQQTITNLKVARAQADGTYSKLAWLAGKYN